MGQRDSSYSFSFHEGGHLFGTVYPQSISPKTVSPRQPLDHRRDQVGRQLRLRAAAQDHLEPPAADLPRGDCGDRRLKGILSLVQYCHVELAAKARAAAQGVY